MNANILFVDDEAPVRELLSLFFRKKGLTVSVAMNISEGKELAEKSRFDLGILDVNLAGENGLELLTLFKQKYPGMPVVIFTSLGVDGALLDKVRAGGANLSAAREEDLPLEPQSFPFEQQLRINSQRWLETIAIAKFIKQTC